MTVLSNFSGAVHFALIEVTGNSAAKRPLCTLLNYRKRSNSLVGSPLWSTSFAVASRPPLVIRFTGIHDPKQGLAM